MSTASALESFLKRANPKEPTHTVHNHLLKLLQRLKEPISSLDDFEKVSNFIKLNEFQLQKPLSEKELAQVKPEPIPHERQIKQTRALFEHDVQLPMCRLPSLAVDSSYLKTAGIALGETESLRLDLSLKTLYSRVKATRLRFWGKILGSKKDYYVAQGLSSIRNTDSVAPGVEKQGEGANYYTFWVTSSSLQEWVELPLVTPEQLRTSKLIKHIFTGLLEQPVPNYPTFSGKEKHLLKAQLVRITHACEIAPKGLYKVLEESPKEIDFEDGFKVPQFAELNSLQTWVHLNQYILHQGRCSYYVSPKLTPEQVEALAAENAEKDPDLERLKPIVQDKPSTLGFQTNWLLRQCGQTLTFNRVGKEEGTTTSYAVALLKNLSWPGAYTVAYSGGWTNIYIGYGMKATQPSFSPSVPPSFQEEPNDGEEYPDPNPKKAPPPAEPPKDEPPADASQ